MPVFQIGFIQNFDQTNTGFQYFNKNSACFHSPQAEV
jgi:hypothetical protein